MHDTEFYCLQILCSSSSSWPTGLSTSQCCRQLGCLVWIKLNALFSMWSNDVMVYELYLLLKSLCNYVCDKRHSLAVESTYVCHLFISLLTWIWTGKEGNLQNVEATDHEIYKYKWFSWMTSFLWQPKSFVAFNQLRLDLSCLAPHDTSSTFNNNGMLCCSHSNWICP